MAVRPRAGPAPRGAGGVALHEGSLQSPEAILSRAQKTNTFFYYSWWLILSLLSLHTTLEHHSSLGLQHRGKLVVNGFSFLLHLFLKT